MRRLRSFIARRREIRLISQDLKVLALCESAGYLPAREEERREHLVTRLEELL